MRTILTLQAMAMLFASTISLAATVEYQDPNLTIVARQEPLDTVLKSLGKEMRIYITVPTGLNPVVNCDIQQQPITQAFKTLLGDMSYSLEWEEKTGQLVGVTILAGGDGVASANPTHAPSMEQPASVSAPVPVAIAGNGKERTSAAPSDPVLSVVEDYAAMAKQQGGIETERAEHEARMETERLEHEARIVEQRAAQEVRMQEEVARHDAELEAELAAEGLQLPQ
jgi:hypothetical protein